LTLVPGTGLEPARLAALDPKSSASANSAIPACAYFNKGWPRLFLSHRHSRYTECLMNIPSQPNIKLVNGPDYRENYANSVQVRVSVWDFFLVFGTLQQQTETQVEVKNFQGIYFSPQQAKALVSILQQNIAGYESAFGEIKLDPRMTAQGPVH
jgi:hypothetical protein